MLRCTVKGPLMDLDLFLDRDDAIAAAKQTAAKMNMSEEYYTDQGSFYQILGGGQEVNVVEFELK